LTVVKVVVDVVVVIVVLGLRTPIGAGDLDSGSSAGSAAAS
jgi:hypothetical protein